LTVKYKRFCAYVELMARRRLVTVEEAILIHLLDYKRYFGEGTVPIEMTQAGISRSIGVRRSHISSSLDVAKGKGLVDERLAHVKGEARRRKCYDLTGMGASEAGELRARVESSNVTATLPDGNGFEGELSELLAIPDISMGLARASLITFDGVVNLPPARARSEMEWTTSVPRTEPFFGRESELEELRGMFDGGIHTAVIYGIPGIGKSALAARAVALHGQGRHTFWFPITEWASTRNTSSHLSCFLESFGFDRLQRYLEAHEVPDLADVRDILAEVKEPSILVFDDCDVAGQSLLLFLKMTAAVARQSSDIKLVLISRKQIDFINATDPHTVTLTLDGLDESSSIGLLMERGFDRGASEKIAGRSGGHPLFLTLAGSAAEAHDEGDVSSILAREIFETMTASEKEVMFSLSVFRKGVRTDAVARDEVQLKSLESLEKRHLAWFADGWHMHNLMKEYFYQRQSRAERSARHENAAEYYNLFTNDTEGHIEEAYHLFEAGDVGSGLLMLSIHGQEFLRQGYLDEILNLTKYVPDSFDEPTELYEALLLNAQALEQTGEWAKAAGSIEKCASVARDLGDTERLSRALQHGGALLYREGRLDDALAKFTDALSPGLPKNLEAKLHNSIGVVQWRMGNTEEARRAYGIDYEISIGANDHQGLARALNNLGILDWQAGEADSALEKYAKALDSAERISDKKLVAILYSNIADAYKAKGDKTEAVRFYERCLELAEDLKFNWQTAEAYRGLADLVEDRDEYLNKALGIFERLGAKEDAKTVRSMME